jgi:hypothetical protein
MWTFKRRKDATVTDDQWRANTNYPDGDVMPMLRLLLALAVTVVLGLASRLYPVDWFFWDRILGEVLYAVAAYLALATLLFRKPPVFIAVLAFACCLAVELFKLTGIPAEYQHVFLVRWFLGMTFSWVNLGYYFVGVVLIAFADYATRDSRRGEIRVSGNELNNNQSGAPATPAPSAPHC